MKSARKSKNINPNRTATPRQSIADTLRDKKEEVGKEQNINPAASGDVVRSKPEATLISDEYATTTDPFGLEADDMGSPSALPVLSKPERKIKRDKPTSMPIRLSDETLQAFELLKFEIEEHTGRKVTNSRILRGLLTQGIHNMQLAKINRDEKQLIDFYEWMGLEY